MTQEDKNLLLKDICARLPYRVKCCIYNFGGDTIRIKEDILWSVQGDNIFTLKSYVEKGEAYMYHQIKPYLFPISNMTDEQKIECFKGTPLEINKYGDIAVKDDLYGGCQYTDLEIYLEVINWLLKNHFDIYGLMPMGLAIDATGLNIY